MILLAYLNYFNDLPFFLNQNKNSLEGFLWPAPPPPPHTRPLPCFGWHREQAASGTADTLVCFQAPRTPCSHCTKGLATCCSAHNTLLPVQPFPSIISTLLSALCSNIRKSFPRTDSFVIYIHGIIVFSSARCFIDRTT